MARYVDIECDAVTEAIGRKAFRNRSDIQDFLDNIPTADVVPVVRCKDCKYFEESTHCTGEKYTGCGWWGYEYDLECNENDYCSYGERRCEDAD